MSSYINGNTDISVKEAGYNPQKLERLASHYQKLVDTGRVQGAGFLLARNGKIFAYQAVGSRKTGDASDPLKPDAIKRIASITKIITATAVMKLVEEGVIWLGQAVSTIIKEFDTDMHRTISVWNLLTHTSGIAADGGYFTEPYPYDVYEQFGKPDWITKGALAGPLQHRPGEQWNYCSTGFAILAEIVSRVSGMHFNDYVEKEVFQALGMTRSFMEVPEKLWPEVIISSEWDEKALENAKDRTGAPSGGGGVYSTLHDLFMLGQAYLNGGEYEGKRILGRKTVEEMTRNQLDGVPAFHWGANCKNYRQGLGWGFYADGPTVGPATYNHEGWGWCSLFVDPLEKFIYISFVADPNDWDPEVMVKPRTIAFAGIL
ncbi:MAG: serine hydrolase [Spirochaetales bacterium]|nr:serine hydrolase [Spirochaetales bacterium]